MLTVKPNSKTSLFHSIFFALWTFLLWKKVHLFCSVYKKNGCWFCNLMHAGRMSLCPQKLWTLLSSTSFQAMLFTSLNIIYHCGRSSCDWCRWLLPWTLAIKEPFVSFFPSLSLSLSLNFLLNRMCSTMRPKV